VSAPSGVVTFLFTDIEGSTRRWEADADAMRVALAAHDKVLRAAIEAHDGFLFSHSGDGVAAAFASPASAIQAAVAAQRELELPVRMGIATGEAELRDADYFGTVLNRAARVMAAGHGGQILVADSTAALLSGVDLVNLGPRRLRDVPIPVGLFQVRAAGLREEFPPLRALDTIPGNLRPATTSFVGRESEVADIKQALREHRLVTLTGVGGVGKTRLAVEVAAQLADEFPDGVWLFELAAVTDPAAVPDAVAAVLGITQQPGKTMPESLAATLEGRVRLLVFDNCEHVLDATADLIEAFFGQSSTVKVLATSREGLGIADEQAWRVRSLDVDTAVALFVERARSVAQGFSADEAVSEICGRLDGIPLAVELAASRMASMTAIEVRDRLDQRFRLLVGSRRGLERHQTLRHAVQWSYDLLAEPERELLERCSVFAGGFDLESACAVAGFDDLDDYTVLDLLDSLVRKSLLIADRSSDRTRFSMLETIRQFSEEQLAASGAATETRTAHARYFAARESDIMGRWDSPRQREAYTWLTVELANLRTAFRWAADRGELDTAAAIATLAGTLGVAIENENYEPAGWAEELLEQAVAVDHPRLATLYVMASQCHAAGRVEDGVRYCEEAESVLDRHPDALPYPINSYLGWAYLFSGQPDRWAEAARGQVQRHGDDQVFVRVNLVMALSFAGRGEEALVAAEGLVEAAEATRNPHALVSSLLAHGVAFRYADPRRALHAFRRGLVVAKDNGCRTSELAMDLADVEAELGHIASALDHATLAIRNYHDSGNTTVIGGALGVVAALLDRLGRHEAAATIAGFASLRPGIDSVYPQITATIAHLRDVLGDQAYESLAREGMSMTTSAVVTYTYDQIGQARAVIERPK
jgi:predicted ATPase